MVRGHMVRAMWRGLCSKGAMWSGGSCGKGVMWGDNVVRGHMVRGSCGEGIMWRGDYVVRGSCGGSSDVFFWCRKKQMFRKGLEWEQ